MAHLIDLSNGRANMAYVGETPWHGLGQALTDGASLDQWRVEAGLDWEAKRNALYYRDAEKVVRKSEKEVLYRSDTGDELGIVSPSYKIVQPEEVVEFFRDLTDLHGFKMETAGSLDGGRKAWALARTEGAFRLMGQDSVKAYVLLATSFDGTLATRAQFTSVRVVCNNTLQIGLKSGSGLAIPHSTGFDATKVKVELGLLESAFSEFQREAEVLAQRKVGKQDAVNFLLDLLADGERDVNKLTARTAKKVQDVYQLFAGGGYGSQFEAANGTAWGLLNAVTQYVDHTLGHSVNNRFKSAQFGAGAELKTVAFAQALKLAA